MRYIAIFTLLSCPAFVLEAQQSETQSSSDAQQTVTTSGGTAGKVAKFAGTHSVVNSAIFEGGGKVGVGTTTPKASLEINGTTIIDGTLTLGSTILTSANSSPVFQAPTDGCGNFAAGFQSLQSVVPVGCNPVPEAGFSNTAVGAGALQVSTGDEDTAVGAYALLRNTSGHNNVAVGDGAMGQNDSGTANVAVGSVALSDNTSGYYNTALGQGALLLNLTGNNNVAVGFSAGEFLLSGSNNIYISNNLATATESGVIRIGTTGSQTSAYISGIYGVATSSGGMPVFIDSNGQLGTMSSSRRYKNAIQDIGDSSDSLMHLRPVSFHYKAEPDSKEYGLIAEEVATVLPEAVVYKDGQPEAVQYSKINALLLNEVQRQHARIEQMEKEFAELKASVLVMQKNR